MTDGLDRATSPALFERNLDALREAQPELFERIHWPVAGDRLQRDGQGRWILHYRRMRLPLALDPEARRAALAPLAAGRRALLFGLGLGELARALLEAEPARELVAWERDPWILRQALGLTDWSEAIRAGRLRFLLGVDLLEVAGDFGPESLVVHPLLGQVYAGELRLAREGPSRRRALLCSGELFVDSVADALRAEGFCLYTFDVQGLAVEELELTVRRFAPELVFGINHVNGLAEFCAERDLPSVIWEVDPATDALAPLTRPAPRTHVFSYRRANVAVYRDAGFEHVGYLPLAADPERRRPVEPSEDERRRYGAPLAFVGSSLRENAEACRRAFAAQAVAVGLPAEEVGRAAEGVLAAQREDLERYRVPELVEATFPGLRRSCIARGLQDPVILLSEVAAAEKRARWMAEVAPLGLDLWGDEGWRSVEGARYRGPAGHDRELPLVYNAARVHLDVGRLYQEDIVTMRVFDVLACGGFVLAERGPALAELFELGVEVESYRGLAELRDKAAAFLADPESARRVAERGRAAVLERHTISGRVRHMLQVLAAPRQAVSPGGS